MKHELAIKRKKEAENKNKTAGYHRHIFGLPILVKMDFEELKAFFFSDKNTIFLHQVF